MAFAVVNGKSVSGWSAIRDFYARAYQYMPVFKIQPQKVTVADNCLILEMTCEGTMAAAATKPLEDEQSSSATPATVRMVGVTLLWWRWEGEGDGNGGSLDSSLLGWKIIEERVYVMRS
ncbi:MAG: hypothetical protein GOMPHAMPRED_002028 [Gomphillus americanus]|uniref:Uncharacterized protein n=1 Tax=Gomphillus americanus TaxID=1940652 RepID=A0A8H3IIQ0_9LECA|nr:MAG: hypothetical protein GOMPHAMPRED_002028 [Gomphillus americanus]